MKARYQYRIYPTTHQQIELAKMFGCCRVVWNDSLTSIEATPKGEKWLSNAQLQKSCITRAKKTERREWLAEVSNIPLPQSIRDLGRAFKNFFDARKGKRKGGKVGLAQFKKKVSRQSARFCKGGFSIKAAKVYLAKIGEIKTKWSRPLPSEPSSVTVIKDRAGRYFISFVVEVEPVNVEPKSQGVGVDLGLEALATLSTGEKVKARDTRDLDRR